MKSSASAAYDIPTFSSRPASASLNASRSESGLSTSGERAAQKDVERAFADKRCRRGERGGYLVPPVVVYLCDVRARESRDKVQAGVLQGTEACRARAVVLFKMIPVLGAQRGLCPPIRRRAPLAEHAQTASHAQAGLGAPGGQAHCVHYQDQ